jgi:hypothetical protein
LTRPGRVARSGALTRGARAAGLWLSTRLSRPGSALTLLGWVCLATALAAAGLVLVRGGVPPTARPLLAIWIPLGIGAAALAGVVVLRLRAHGSEDTGAVAAYPLILRSLVGALVVLVPVSLVPLSLFLWRTTSSPDYLLFSFLDHRYIIAAYYVVVLGVPMSLLVGAHLTAAAREDRTTEKPPDTPPTPPARATLRRALRPVLAVIAGATTATYFYGPPWGLRPLGGPIDFHETVHFTGLQAINSGALPYIGAGSDQYGPLSQLFLFSWMKLIGGFTLAGVREAFAAQHWLAVAFVCIVVLLFLPPRAAALGLALAVLVFPTFQLFGYQANGPFFVGFFGWANVWRYSGLLLLGLALPSLMLRDGRAARWSFVALGAAWGVTCLLAQENLFGGVLVVLAVVAALAVSRTVTLRRLRQSLVLLGAGAGAVALPLLVTYAVFGQARPLLRNYLLVPLAVARGYSNTTFLESGPVHTTYLLLPLLTLACGLIAVLRARPLAVTGPWSRQRAALFGCFSAAAVAQAGAFLRADSSHLYNVMLITPILVGATAALAGPLLGFQHSLGRALIGLCVVAAAWAMLPWEASSLEVARSRLGAPLSARTSGQDSSNDGPPLAGTAGRRLGPGYQALVSCCSSSNVPVAEFVRFANELHGLVGNRRTYVSPNSPDGQPGLWYFIADLPPFDLPLESTSMAIDVSHLQTNLSALADPQRPLSAVVTTNPDAKDSRIAIKRLGPNPRTRRLSYAGNTVLVFVTSQQRKPRSPSASARP